MKKVLYLFIFLSAVLVRAQNNDRSRDSIAKYTQQDFSQMKEQLGITIPNRPGPSGNPADPNAANTDENKVGSYSLPDPLVTSNGTQVRTEKAWWDSRRPEIVAQFEKEMYGHVPNNIPDVRWTVVSEKDTTAGPYPVTETLLIGKVDNSDHPDIEVNIELLIGLPKDTEKAVPLVTRFGFINWPFGPPPTEPNSYFMSSYEPLWKQQLISQNWGYAILVPSTIQADHGAGLTSGIIGLVNKGAHRSPEQWGVLRAWAWGAGRAMDYFETQPKIDASKIGIEGTSRYGKAALVTMAFDPRFSLGFIGSSGAGGASLLRRNFGEMVENLASSGEYHWFAGNFIKYASSLTVDDLPVDAHELIALCAPRPVFISVGSPFIEGNWVDGKGMFLAGLHASPVYALLGKKGMESEEYPVIGRALTSGEVAFRQHAGGHSTGPNWSTWIAWAHKYWDN
ncbi:glucuronyl esterase domain-containing protein [Pareuzebyella sediminis]|uniref:glucuronyl esterase domain-containing protein n=1 Tax=Pareuzebyella sediminis TaxID=2607998 RepID=UPI0011EF1B3E|nr:acetylxylan esterase [Pareuzebyella sediminis]